LPLNATKCNLQRYTEELTAKARAAGTLKKPEPPKAAPAEKKTTSKKTKKSTEPAAAAAKVNAPAPAPAAAPAPAPAAAANDAIAALKEKGNDAFAHQRYHEAEVGRRTLCILLTPTYS
jgi:hypothetical protein